MKFNKYLAAHQTPEWREQYIRYGELKRLLGKVLDSNAPVEVPTALSLTVARERGAEVTPQEAFFLNLEADVGRIDSFTQDIAERLRARLREVVQRMGAPDQQQVLDPGQREALLAAARGIGEDYLHLEKYVNLNYAGLQKILKKHDKCIPTAPCSNFYRVHISRQPWARGDHHDIQATLSRTFSRLHMMQAAAAGGGPGGAASSGRNNNSSSSSAAGSSQVVATAQQVLHRLQHTSKYWVRQDDLAQVRHVVMQHLAVLPNPPPSSSSSGAAAAAVRAAGGAGASSQGQWEDQEDQDMVNILFLDNPSLELYHALLYGRPYATTLQIRWRGSRVPDTVHVMRQVHREGWRPEACSEDRFAIQETRVAEFLTGRWTWADARKLLFPEERPVGGVAAGADRLGLYREPDTDPARLALEYQTFKTFTEVQRLVESKGLQPIVKARFRQTVFQAPYDSEGVAVRLEEDLELLLEYAYDGATRLAHGLWRQEHPADSIEFPYAVLKVHRHADEPLPAWLQELLASGLLVQVNDFSKFLHGCAGLMPDMVRAVPQWVDDPAVQKSLYANIMANEDITALQLAGHNVVEELEDGRLAEAEEEMVAAAAAVAAAAGTSGRGRSSQPASRDRSNKGAAAAAASKGSSNRRYGDEHDDDEETGMLQPLLGARVGENQRRAQERAAAHTAAAAAAAAAASNSRRPPRAPSLAEGRAEVAAVAVGPTSSAAAPSAASSNGGGGMGMAWWSWARSDSLHQPQTIAASLAAGAAEPDKQRDGCHSTSGGANAAAAAQRQISMRRSAPAAPPCGAAKHGTGGGGAAADGSSPIGPLAHALQHSVSARLGANGPVQGGWQAKLLQRHRAAGLAYRPQLMFVDPLQFMRNERIFLLWLCDAITVSGIAVGMLGFAANAKTRPTERPTIHIGAVTALVLMAVAIAMTAYGLGSYVWRSSRFYELHAARFDDTTGTLAMTALVVLALFALMVFNIADLMEILADQQDDGGGGG